MSHAMARAAIEKKLFDWAKAKPLPAFFGIQKGDMQKPMFIRGFLLPASTTSPYLHDDGIHYSGLYQVTISCDPSQAMGVAEGVVDEINGLFPVNSLLEKDQFSGIIQDPVYRGPTIIEDNRYNIPVTIPYRGEVSN